MQSFSCPYKRLLGINVRQFRKQTVAEQLTEVDTQACDTGLLVNGRQHNIRWDETENIGNDTSSARFSNLPGACLKFALSSVAAS